MGSSFIHLIGSLFFKEHYVLIDFNVLVFDEFHFLVVIILDEAHIAPTFGQWQPLRVGSFIFYHNSNS